MTPFTQIRNVAALMTSNAFFLKKMRLEMKADFVLWVSRFLRYILLLGTALYVGVYVILAFFRIQYPYELEWMEGVSVDQVVRIISGQNLYIKPSLDFVPLAYPPFYYYLSAFISSITGVGYLPLRLLSFISSLGCFLIIYIIVRRETESKFAGFLACGLFAASFRISGAWFDIARVDSLFLLFLLVALYFVKDKPSLGVHIFAGVFISLSFLTKQTALVVFVVMALYSLIVNWRYSIVFIGTAVAITLTSTLILNYMYDDWYKYYIFELPRQRVAVSFLSSRLITFWTEDILQPLPIACLMSIFYGIIHTFNSAKKASLFYFFMIATGMIGASFLSRWEAGAYNNVLLPAYAIISILFGLATHTFLHFVKAIAQDKHRLLVMYLYLACLMQFAILIYNPFDLVPTIEDVAAGKTFIQTMTQIDGEILVLHHAYLPTLAGKASHAQLWAMVDVLWADQGKIGSDLSNEVSLALQEQKFNAIILDSESHWFQKEVEVYYVKQRPVFDNQHVFWSITGSRTRPEWIYVPKAVVH